MLNFTIGADPELFLVDGSGKFISSIGKIGGSKEEPADCGEGCAVQEDNVAVEFNIPPASSFERFKESLDYGLKFLEDKAKGMNLRLAIEASAEFHPDQLTTPKALEFGCEPDFNAWTTRQNDRPTALNKLLRSCGGHVHVGTKLDPILVIRAMDLFLGCPSTILDKDTRRRELYGKAGAFRYKPYGCEYRTLSNFWLGSADLMKWAYDGTARALSFVEEGKEHIDHTDAEAIQACINKGDKDAYMYLDKRFNLGL